MTFNPNQYKVNPINFDPNKYKQVGQQMFGPKAFDFSNVQKTVQMQAQADALQKQFMSLYQQRLHPPKPKKPKVEKKTYQDAVDYINANKDQILNNDPVTGPDSKNNTGAYRIAQEIRNDPNKQAQIKAQGYSVTDYINALYAAASGGKFRSEREYNQYVGKLTKDVSERDKAYKDKHGMTQDQAYALQQKANKINKPNHDSSGVLGNISGLFKDIGHDVSQRASGTGQELSNIWKAISDGPGGYKLSDVAKDTQKTIKSKQKADANRGFSSPLSKEVHRGANRAVDAAMFNNMSAYQNAENAKGYNFNTDYANTRKFGKGGATDFITSGLGLLAPGNAALKATKIAGVGERSAALFGKKLSPNLANIASKGAEGAGAGGLFGTMQSIADPNMTGKQRLENIALNTGLGAIADPLLNVAGSRIARFFGKDKVAKSELDNALKDPNTPNEVKQEILALPAPKVAGYLNEGQRLALPEGKTVSKPRFDSPTNQSNGEVLALPPHNPNANEILDYLLPKIKPEVEQAMTPPLENPRELKKWVREHTDIPIKQLDTLPPKDLHDMAIQVRNSLRVPDVAQEIAHKYGYDLEALLNGQVKDLNGVNSRRNFAETAGIPQNKLNMDILNNPQVGSTFKPKERYVPMDKQPLNFTGKNTQPLSLKVQPVIKEAPPLNFSKKMIVNKNSPDLVNQLQIKLNPKKEVAATAENITPQRSNESSLVRVDSVPSSQQKLLDGIDTANLKDAGGLKAYTSDVYRIFQDVFGKHFNQIKQRLLDPFDKAKGENVDLQKALVNQMDQVIIKKLGIKPGSKESALVQMFGEGEIGLDELKKQAPTKWKDIVAADKWFHDQYDKLLKAVNTVRAKLYPGQSDKIVPARKDYYRHFKELNGLEGLKNLFDTPAGIDPHLAGTSEFTRPNSRYASFMQKRGKGPYKRDAVGGYLNYVPAATYAIKIDPFVKQFNQLANELADSTAKTSHLNTFIGFLKDFSGDLAGKTNFLDRPLQKLLGRKTFHVLDWLNKRVKSNVILGNMSSALAQLANIPQGVGFAKQYSIKGATNTLKSILDHEKSPINGSDFIKERYGHSIYNKFDTKWLNQPKKFASWTMEAVDKIGTSFVWNSAYEKGLAQKVANPVKYADDVTRSLVAGRGIGEVPLAQKSKIVQLIAPFQLEVANLWRVQKDFLKNKDIGGLLTLYLAAHLINKGMESVRGNGVTFDPIQAIIDASSESDLTSTERGGRLAGEILSNLPLGQTLANFYPEYGTKSLPTRKELFGKNDPNRFGSGLLIAKGVQDPLAKVVLPYGGNQLEKTFKGIKAINNEGVYNKQKTQLNYPVKNNLENRLKSTLFGPGAFKETQNYYNQDLRPLSVNQTKIYNENKKAGSGIGYYNLVQENRLEDRLKKVLNDTKLTNKQKDNKLQDLMKRLKALQAQ